MKNLEHSVNNSISQKRPLEFNDNENVRRKSPKSIQDISEVLHKMDQKYSAVFSSWIKKQENLHSTITHLCRVANDYPLSQIILAMQWLIVDWKLKSIIVLVENITIGWRDERHLALLVKGLAEKWKAAYISELVLSVLQRWDNHHSDSSERKQSLLRRKESFLKTLMRGWNFNQISNVLMRLDEKVSWNVKASIFKWYHQNEIAAPKTQHFSCNPSTQLFRNSYLSIPSHINSTPLLSLTSRSLFSGETEHRETLNEPTTPAISSPKPRSPNNYAMASTAVGAAVEDLSPLSLE